MTAPVTISAAGRLVRDPDARTTANGKDMTLATVAVDLSAGRDADPETWWLSLLAFGRMAGELAKHRKGDRLAVMGSLERRPYTTRDGERRDGWTVLCDAVLGPRSPRPSGGRNSERSGASNRRENSCPPPSGPSAFDGLPPLADDEVPF